MTIECEKCGARITEGSKPRLCFRCFGYPSGMDDGTAAMERNHRERNQHRNPYTTPLPKWGADND